MQVNVIQIVITKKIYAESEIELQFRIKKKKPACKNDKNTISRINKMFLFATFFFRKKNGHHK